MRKSIKAIIIISVCSLSGIPVFAQSSFTGFYVIVETKEGCANLTPSLVGVETYCLPQEAVVAGSEFEWASVVKYDDDRQSSFMDLRLTTTGYKTMKTLAARLPDARIALVVDGKVVGIFESPGPLVHRSIPLRGDASEIEWIHDKIKIAKH